MRLPRVRFTVGKMLLAVAFVAANCGAFRYFDDAPNHDGITQSLMVFTACFLPLINVALIGTFLYVANRLRSRRRKDETTPRRPPAGVTFFCLHFLVLGFLACVFMLDTIARYVELERFSSLFDQLENGWARLGLGSLGDFDYLLEFSLIALFIWAPLLLLAWVGGLLAKRYAAGQSRRRVRAMMGLVSLGFGLAGLAICVLPQRFSEDQDVDLDFHIVDSVSGRPIASALLSVTDAFLRPWVSPAPIVFSGADGRTRLRCRFEVSGERNAFYSMGHFSAWGSWLEISTQGYRPLRIPLTEVLGPLLDPKRVPLKNVALDRGETAKDSFEDLAGEYDQQGGPVQCGWLRVEPDGRFGWIGLRNRHWYMEYGYIKRTGMEIELIPVTQPGREAPALADLLFRSFRWGNGLYLAHADEDALVDLCRHALFVNRKWGSADAVYLRASDSNKPQAGLPRLPLKIWVRFLASELSPSNEEGSLRLALDSLSRMRRGKRVGLEARAN